MSVGRAVKTLSVPVAMSAVIAAVLATRVRRRWGATVSETRRVLPGDDLLPGAAVQNDRACTIPATPSALWPWIAQLGQEKAGFYSFEFLENLIGCQITGAERIHPEWQRVEVGDRFKLHPEVALRVAEVDAGHHLVVTSQGGDAPGDVDFDMTWAFVLAPTATPGATRLHLRERYATRRTSERLMIEATSVVSAIMTWRMMSRLAGLAEDDRPETR